MKVWTHTFGVFLILVLGLLHVQPLFFHAATKEQVCSKSKCSKQKTSDKPKDSNEKGNCPSEGCNPFVQCPLGSCCYIVENLIPQGPIPAIKKQKLPLIDDNKLSNRISECWHPPEITF